MSGPDLLPGERRVFRDVPVATSEPELGGATWSVMTWTGSRWKPLGSGYATRSDAENSSAFRTGRRHRGMSWSRTGLVLHSPTWHVETGWFGVAVLVAGAAVAAWWLRER